MNQMQDGWYWISYIGNRQLPSLDSNWTKWVLTKQLDGVSSFCGLAVLKAYEKIWPSNNELNTKYSEDQGAFYLVFGKWMISGDLSCTNMEYRQNKTVFNNYQKPGEVIAQL